jgi:hypothetical protein
MKRFALVLLFACTGKPPTPPPVETCKVHLPPRGAVPPPAPPTDPPPMTHASRIVAEVDLKLSSITGDLEKKVPPRLADEHGKPAGGAGHLNYTVDRGPFTATVEHDALVIHTDIHAHAEACKGKDCYASCAPEGKASAAVSLRLDSQYRFTPSHVTFAFTKGCEVKVLGGILRVDVTPMIAAQLEPTLRNVEHQIDGSLPPMQPQAAKLWSELGKPRSLPLGGCAVVNPRNLVEGPIAGTPDALRVRIGLNAYPEITSTPCGAPPAQPPLPPLAQDPTMPGEDDVVLALTSPLASANIVGGSVTRAAIVQSGAQAQLDVTLHGETCGDETITAPVEWADGSSLRFAAADVRAQTFATAISPSVLPMAVPALASSVSDPTVTVSAKVTSTSPLVAVLRNGNVVAYAIAHGSLQLAER